MGAFGVSRWAIASWPGGIDRFMTISSPFSKPSHPRKAIFIAAPQVGVPLRVIVIQMPEKEAFCLINPQVVRRKGERLVNEGCLSIPGYVGEITRSKAVTVKGCDKQGKEIRIKAEELLAQALEHEIDHINGILYIDHMEDMDKLRKVEPGEKDGEDEEGEETGESG